MRDLYEILGVSAGASPDELKQAWRALSRQYHPDRKGGSADRMAEVNEAYRILRDPSLRAEYDEKGKVGVKSAPLSRDAQAVQVLVGVLHTFDHISHPAKKMAAIKEQAEKMAAVTAKELLKLNQNLQLAERRVKKESGLWESSSDQPNVFDLALQIKVENLKKEIESIEASIEGLRALIALLGTYKLTKAGERLCEEVEAAPRKDDPFEDLFKALIADPGTFHYKKGPFHHGN